MEMGDSDRESASDGDWMEMVMLVVKVMEMEIEMEMEMVWQLQCRDLTYILFNSGAPPVKSTVSILGLFSRS